MPGEERLYYSQVGDNYGGHEYKLGREGSEDMKGLRDRKRGTEVNRNRCKWSGKIASQSSRLSELERQ